MDYEGIQWVVSARHVSRQNHREIGKQIPVEAYKGRMPTNPFQNEDSREHENRQEEDPTPEVTDPGRLDTTDK